MFALFYFAGFAGSAVDGAKRLDEFLIPKSKRKTRTGWVAD